MRHLLAALLILLAAWPAAAEASRTGPVRIAVLVSSDKNRCFEPGTVRAIKRFTLERAAAHNRAAADPSQGIAIDILDDHELAETTVANVASALAAPDLVAMIGLPSSTRGKAVFEALGPDLEAAAVPFLSEISMNGLFQGYPAVYSMASTVGNELDVVKAFIRDRGFLRPAFIGLADDDYARALGDGLRSGPDAAPLVTDTRIRTPDNRLAQGEAAAILADLTQRSPDLLILAIQSGPGGELLKALVEGGLSKVPVLVLYGRVNRILDRLGNSQLEADAFELGREGVPRVTNERLQRRIWDEGGDGFIFDDLPDRSAPGWKDGTCTENPNAAARRLLDEANRRAIGRGTQYADLVDIVAGVVAASPPGASVPDLRKAVAGRLAALASGRAIARGLWQDWSFTSRRTAADDVLIVMRPQASALPVLAPWQYRRAGDALVRIPVVHLSIDLVSLSRIDASDESFDAEFYLSLRSEDPRIGIGAIAFTNAYRSQSDEGRVLSIQEVHGGEAGSRFPPDVKVYKVSGKFTFAPELDDYPFDTQRLTLSFEPASTSGPFLIQPPADDAESRPVAIDGWELRTSYVGSEQDMIPVVDGARGGKRVVSFSKFNQTYVASRVPLDFYLRVVIPLVAILLVTWFSIYLRAERFDAIMGIQVTALLSAIALFLSLPDIGADRATLSDRMFIVTYAAVSLMIGLSVMKDSPAILAIRPARLALLAVQHIGLPVATLVAMLWLILASGGVHPGF